MSGLRQLIINGFSCEACGSVDFEEIDNSPLNLKYSICGSF